MFYLRGREIANKYGAAQSLWCSTTAHTSCLPLIPSSASSFTATNKIRPRSRSKFECSILLSESTERCSSGSTPTDSAKSQNSRGIFTRLLEWSIIDVVEKCKWASCSPFLIVIVHTVVSCPSALPLSSSSNSPYQRGWWELPCLWYLSSSNEETCQRFDSKPIVW